jgi:ATP-dependent Zn protease
MSEKVGTRSFREEEQDAGLGFVRVNDISPTMQEMIDLEIKRLMQVEYLSLKKKQIEIIGF